MIKMMNREIMRKHIEALGDDVSYSEQDSMFHVTIEDMLGFDENWCEVEREYDDTDAVVSFLEMLEANCISYDNDYRRVYHFDGYDVKVVFASDDI